MSEPSGHTEYSWRYRRPASHVAERVGRDPCGLPAAGHITNAMTPSMARMLPGSGGQRTHGSSRSGSCSIASRPATAASSKENGSRRIDTPRRRGAAPTEPSHFPPQVLEPQMPPSPQSVRRPHSASLSGRRAIMPLARAGVPTDGTPIAWWDVAPERSDALRHTPEPYVFGRSGRFTDRSWFRTGQQSHGPNLRHITKASPNRVGRVC